MYQVTVTTRKKTYYFRGVEFVNTEFSQSFTNEKWVRVNGKSSTGIFLASEVVSVIISEHSAEVDTIEEDKKDSPYIEPVEENTTKTWTRTAGSNDLKVTFPKFTDRLL